jgi:L-alanine-DL-glutamate epimerase-like enolase superfamily enzyme
MKIDAVHVSGLSIPNTPPTSSQYALNRYVVARIQTDQGIEGLGYTMCIGGGGADAIRAYIEASLVPQLIGENPLDVNRLWQKMYDADRGIRKKGVAAYALSAMDIGLWDILGKAANMPVYRLLGANKTKIPVYGSGGFISYSVDEIIKEAEGFLALGCKAYKMKIGRPNLMENVERVGAVRKALGPKISLMVDVNQRWDVATNIRVANRLAEYDLEWYEEPVLADNIVQCAEVARGIPITVATGENEATRYGFRDLIDAKAARILQPDVQRCGGFGEMMRIAHLAAPYDITIAPHLVPELSIHVLAAIPNGSYVEWLAGWSSEMWRDPPEIVDGFMSPPERPGHGMEFSADAIKRYTE